MLYTANIFVIKTGTQDTVFTSDCFTLSIVHLIFRTFKERFSKNMIGSFDRNFHT